MGVETNTERSQEDAARSSAFGGTTFTSDAPSGSSVGGSFMNLYRKFSFSSIPAAVKPYLEETMKIVEEHLGKATLIPLERVPNSYAIRYDGPDGIPSFFCVLFTSSNEPPLPKFRPTSQKFETVTAELRERFSKGNNIRVVDACLIFSDYQPDMDRFTQMGYAIVRSFAATADPSTRDAQITDLTDREFVVNWSLSQAQHYEDAWSPHGVRPRMDIGCTLSAKIVNQTSQRFRETDVEYQPVGVIGGYMDIREEEPVMINGQQQMRYQPVFVITVIDAIIPLEGIAAILMDVLAPTIYNTYHWIDQWRNLGPNGIDPGVLREDPANPGKPFTLKSREEVLQFVQTFFNKPHIALSIMDGRKAIPGMWRLGAADQGTKNQFIRRLTDFFGTAPEDLGSATITLPLDARFEGTVGDSRGTLTDSRDIDYLWAANKNGVSSIDRDQRFILMGGANATARAEYIRSITGSFQSYHANEVMALNPDFFAWISQKALTTRLTITDPDSHQEVRPLGSILSSFGSAAGVASIVSSGQSNLGFQYNSFRNF